MALLEKAEVPAALPYRGDLQAAMRAQDGQVWEQMRPFGWIGVRVGFSSWSAFLNINYSQVTEISG